MKLVVFKKYLGWMLNVLMWQFNLCDATAAQRVGVAHREWWLKHSRILPSTLQNVVSPLCHQISAKHLDIPGPSLLCAAYSRTRTSPSLNTAFPRAIPVLPAWFQCWGFFKVNKTVTISPDHPSTSCVSDCLSAGCHRTKAKGTAFHFCLWQSPHWTGPVI